MNHPAHSDLALFAGGDLTFFPRRRVAQHLAACGACHDEVEALRSASVTLQETASELPPGLNWDRLAREMTANIHLGIEAGECVGPARTRMIPGLFERSREFNWPRVLNWRAATATAILSVVLVTAWVLNPPSRRAPHEMAARPGVELRNTATGLELNENGSALVLLHGRGMRSQKPIISSAPGALRARFVDEDTDQITINHVYAE